MKTTEGDHDWEKARELFLDLVELEPAARRARLEAIGADAPSLRARVERLLANDRGGGPASDPPSRRFGPYETVRPIAEGGMGEVHLARRVDGEFELQVAVKLLKPHLGGEELVARFQRERQTLAQLDHAYITRLLDGGKTPDGTPYLVMEYVDGRPLDRYCEERGLDLDERLELFQRVLSAVVHAHGRGVIHRDLKPNNILVRDDGAPRLLDFGISRPADPEATPGGPLTRTGHRLFTPEYAAPEQVRGAEVDQSTDVFALGVLLYQLLTGEKPWRVGDGGLHELEMAILEQDPLPPSRLETGTARRAIAGNLDTITLKCLAKDPRERYAGALDLAADLDLHRRGLPIRARRLQPLLRVARQLRRHPFAVAAGIALLVAAAAAAYGVRQHGAAERRRVELVASIEAQVDLARNLREQSRPEAAAEELDEALAATEAIPGEAYVRALVLGQIAVTRNHLEEHEAALDVIDRAESLLSTDDPRSVRMRASLYNARSHALGMLGDHAAWTSATEALRYARDHLPPADELTVDAAIEVATQSRARGDLADANAVLDRIARECREHGDEYDDGLARVMNTWGLTLAADGEHEAAIGRMREALRIMAYRFGDGHASIAQVRTNLGRSYQQLGRFADARDQLRRALETWNRLDNLRRAAQCVLFLARVADQGGELDVAEERYAEAIELYGRDDETDPGLVHQALLLLGEVQERAGRLDAARESLARAAEDLDGSPYWSAKLQARARDGLDRIARRSANPSPDQPPSRNR